MTKKYATSIVERANLLMQNNYLPLSWLIKYPVDKNGRVIIDENNSIRFSDGSENIRSNGVHEKNRPDLFGVNVPNTEFYQAHFVSSKNVNKVIANSALEIYPLNGQRVTSIVNQNDISPYTGTAIVNYENLISADGRTVAIVRLKEFLIGHDLKDDIDTFYDLQQVIKNPEILKLFTPRGIDQLALSSYFIPNAIGETDANSRNILLVIDPETGLIDSVIRIDPDKNSCLSNNDQDECSFITKGILQKEEPYNQYMGLIKNHAKFDLIDWELFNGYYELSKRLLTPNNIRKSIFKGYEINQGRCGYSYNEPFFNGRSVINLSIQAYEEFIHNIDKRITKMYQDIDARIFNVRCHLPLEDSPYFDVLPFKSQLFYKNGESVPIEEIPEGPTFF